eukprot:10223121-Lingulodinium_polyedra.AAC.1
MHVAPCPVPWAGVSQPKERRYSTTSHAPATSFCCAQSAKSNTEYFMVSETRRGSTPSVAT